MARPKTKTELLLTSQDTFDKLLLLLSSFTNEELIAPFTFSDEFLEKQKGEHWLRDQNKRDMLIHLYEWHQLLLTCVKNNSSNTVVPFLPSPYNWKNYGEMNQMFFEKHQNTSYDEALRLLKSSHESVMELIEAHSNEELFEKNIFPWTNTTTFGSYCVSATSSHYEWAIKKIKQSIKPQNNK
ncbi:ClbS/DfsB family four-helix bundle protein [Vagococcus coleopterorum]|uniref:ClbS/DfsB family four-helix bundle protein n=1 Tax=Vagococcus coleopterorum TaxID=2714946 RepID=A0A6G8AP51_9ENTE|nr:ClbS/DfsB family four-helix bundle protein [Vagococcus coleopterorum]QIL46851.1 ClbS/DfsB family four-helix bundle protein [Vagococcus coleopterorum]